MKLTAEQQQKIRKGLREIGIFGQFKPLGYAIHLYESDEFVAFFDQELDSTAMIFAPRPEQALRFQSLEKAKKIAQYSKHEATVVFLVDTKRHLFICPVED